MMNWTSVTRLLAGVAMAAGCGGGDDGPSATGTLGHIAFTEADTGALVIVDVATGARVERTFPQGTPGAITIEPGGGHVAFSIGAERNLFVADATTGEAVSVTPSPGNYAPVFWWGIGGWFTYIRQAGTPAPEIRLVTVAGGESRTIAGYGAAFASAIDDSFLVSRCTSVPASGPCPGELLFGRALDGSSRVVTTGPYPRIVAWLEERGEVVAYEAVGESSHLVVIDVATGARRELGAFWPSLEENGFGRGLSDVSPDATELLTSDGTDIVAVRLDGSGSRPIAEGWPHHVGFTSRGDIVVERTTNVGSGDVLELLYDLFVLRDGESVQLVDHVPRCYWAAPVTPDGSEIAWSCEGGTKVFSLPDGALVREHPEGEVLGFTADGGIAAVQYTSAGPEVAHWPRDGAEQLLGRLGSGSLGDAGPSASYSPH